MLVFTYQIVQRYILEARYYSSLYIWELCGYFSIYGGTGPVNTSVNQMSIWFIYWFVCLRWRYWSVRCSWHLKAFKHVAKHPSPVLTADGKFPPNRHAFKPPGVLNTAWAFAAIHAVTLFPVEPVNLAINKKAKIPRSVIQEAILWASCCRECLNVD